MTNSIKTRTLLVGNRIPYEFFICSGSGESDITVHAGSFHLALCKAGIGMKNILTYSSVLPAESREVPKPDKMKQGDVMEVIMAAGHCRKGERITAGMAVGWLYERETEEKSGGRNRTQTARQLTRDLQQRL